MKLTDFPVTVLADSRAGACSRGHQERDLFHTIRLLEQQVNKSTLLCDQRHPICPAWRGLLLRVKGRTY